MKVDALVIGAGTAGLTASTRLAHAGLRVLLVATGEGSLPLATGTIDVLGYSPGLVSSPFEALPTFLHANPEHPYRIAGIDGVEHALAWLAETAESLGYQGGLVRNRWVPTVLGGLRPTSMLPRSMVSADLHANAHAEIVVAGIRGYRDFHPALLAANLCLATPPSGGRTIRARATEVEWPGNSSDLVPFRLARRLEEAAVRREIANRIRPSLGGATAVAMPALLGRERWDEVHRDLEGRLERDVFEVPGLPPSLPGLRLSDCLRRALRRAGGRLLLGSSAVSATRVDGEVRSVTVTQAARHTEVKAGFVILATGGFAAGGIARDRDGTLREPLLGLPVHGPQVGAEPTSPRFLGSQPLDRAGVRTDPTGRPLDTAGEPWARNLYAAGAVLAGAVPWREKSGEGVALATAWAVTGAILGGAQ